MGLNNNRPLRTSLMHPSKSSTHMKLHRQAGRCVCSELLPDKVNARQTLCPCQQVCNKVPLPHSSHAQQLDACRFVEQKPGVTPCRMCLCYCMRNAWENDGSTTTRHYLTRHSLLPGALPQVSTDDKLLGEVLLRHHAPNQVTNFTITAVLAVLCYKLLFEAYCAGCSSDSLL